MAGKEFRINEGQAVAPIMLGELELAEKPSPDLSRRLKAAAAVVG